MQSILRLAAASPRVQRSVSMRSGTGWGSHGHSSMQVKNENTLHPGSNYSEVQDWDPKSN